jgi:hypothetical protein
MILTSDVDHERQPGDASATLAWIANGSLINSFEAFMRWRLAPLGSTP